MQRDPFKLLLVLVLVMGYLFSWGASPGWGVLCYGAGGNVAWEASCQPCPSTMGGSIPVMDQEAILSDAGGDCSDMLVLGADAPAPRGEQDRGVEVAPLGVALFVLPDAPRLVAPLGDGGPTDRSSPRLALRTVILLV